MKLLIASDIFPPESGGPATYVVNLANALVKDGIEVKIVSLNPDGEHVSPFDSAQGRLLTYHVSERSKILKYLEYMLLLFKHAKDVDVIYAMGPVNAGLPTCLVSWLRRKKSVVKVVGDYAWEQGVQRFGVKDLIDDFQKKSSYGFSVWLLRKIQYGVVKRVSKVIVPSRYLKKIVVGWGVEKENVEVIYNAIKVRDVEPAEKPENEKWIVSVGRLVPWKGMGTLIEIMPQLLKEFPSLKLKIIGDGPLISDFIRQPTDQISDLRLEDNVELLGALPREKTLSYIAAADVFVLNSGYEGLSHVILEAKHLGVPVIASNMGGNPEVVGKEDLFEYDDNQDIKDKIIEVLGKNTVVTETKLERFSFKTMFDNTKKVFEEVCAS